MRKTVENFARAYEAAVPETGFRLPMISGHRFELGFFKSKNEKAFAAIETPHVKFLQSAGIIKAVVPEGMVTVVGENVEVDTTGYTIYSDGKKIVISQAKVEEKKVEAPGNKWGVQ